MSSGGDQRLDGGLVGDRRDDRAFPDHRVALEIHLGDQPLREAMAEDREMDMRRAPVVDAVRPGIGAGLDGAEGVAAVLVGDGAAAAAEIRIERREIALLLVAVAAAGIGLPEFEQRAGNAHAALVEHAAIDDDALADGAFARLGEIVDQVVVEFAQHGVAEDRAGDLRQRVVERQQRLLRRAQHRGLVARRAAPADATSGRAGRRRRSRACGSSRNQLASVARSASISENTCLAILKAWLAAGTPA